VERVHESERALRSDATLDLIPVSLRLSKLAVLRT
jgi:hypothetical protein